MPFSTYSDVPWHSKLHKSLEQFSICISSNVANSIASLTTTSEHIGCMGHMALASISARMHAQHRQLAARKKRLDNESVGFLAASPSEIKARLAGVPIYAVVNAKKEFILVSGDDDTDRQMALLFFSATDAAGFEKTLKQENPKLGKSAQVLPTSLEAVYELVQGKGGLVKNGDKEVDVSFRFMPDSKQVMNALELYKRAGIAKDGFVGVPLFQAEGLTVRGEQSRFTPLFFSKEDVMRALKDTHANATSATVGELQGKIDRVKREMEEKPEKKAELSKRLAGYEKRLKDVGLKKKPDTRIDVGSFEDVLEKMMNDKGGAWDDVVFVPCGSLAK
jgi:hypothetical protein